MNYHPKLYITCSLGPEEPDVDVGGPGLGTYKQSSKVLMEIITAQVHDYPREMFSKVHKATDSHHPRNRQFISQGAC